MEGHKCDRTLLQLFFYYMVADIKFCLLSIALHDKFVCSDVFCTIVPCHMGVHMKRRLKSMGYLRESKNKKFTFQDIPRKWNY